MNKAVTEGIQLMPPPFANGLGQWSSGDGTPGSASYAGALNAALVAADQDFGACLELQKTEATQKLRHMGVTPVSPGCYLQVRVRLKALSGNLPAVRIAAWVGDAGGVHLTGRVQTGPQVQLTQYGAVVELRAILGTGVRGGVDMAWGAQARQAHVGLDLTGPNGGVVRIDDIEVTDVSAYWQGDLLGRVDVRDYGALGDGISDDTAAFLAADAAAQGRTVLVPEGVFHLAGSVTFRAPVLFQGRVTQPADQMLLLTRNFDYPSYSDAFGDEELAFRKAFQALLNNVDHESLDLCGRKITVTAPIDMAAAVPNRSTYETRRVIRNGQFVAGETAAWDTQTFTSQASYDPADPRRLSNVANVANIPVGALVQGAGVGREVYVRERNIGAGTLTLNAPLYDAAGTQVFTFRAFKYMLDFSGFSRFSQFAFSDVEFQCSGLCSGLRLAPLGTTFSLRDCFVSRPRDRGLTSIGGGCQGMLLDRCQFLSTEDSLNVPDRVTIAVNANANDVKLRDCRATRFLHFAVLAGNNTIITGNHFFQGDGIANGVRSAGLVIMGTYSSTTITHNYVDNCFIEWTNEQDPTPGFDGGFSFSAMSITDNIFLSGDVAPWFSYLVIKPHGAGHFLNGVTVTGNLFRTINGGIDRAERVDTSFADLNFAAFKDVTFDGNTFHLITAQCKNPLRLRHDQATAAATWVVSSGGELPFGGRARRVDGLVQLSRIETAAGSLRHLVPQVLLEQGANRDQVHLLWPEPVRGKVDLIVRIDR